MGSGDENTPSGSLVAISTERLLATRLGDGDFDDIQLMHDDARVMATLGGVRAAEDTRRFLRTADEHWQRYGYGLWLLRARADGRFVGRGGLRHLEVGGGPEVEVAYGFMPEAWGSGFATEIARAVLSVAFERIGLASVVAFALTDNLASHRVMRKVGLEFERDIVHAGLPHVLYRIDRNRFFSTRPD